ncbi:MAG: hypothetical protein SFU27_06845 [Thermonemataceae bacterium]|nr:hypothetical protein [Thermonemataceae bacterium]
MKKDIDFPLVEGVQVAMVRQKNEWQEYEWYAYLLNTKEIDLYNVIIACSGYGEIAGESRKTSTMRYLFEKIPALGNQLIEPIAPELLSFCSEYWVSYYINEAIFDKRFIFAPEMLQEQNFVYIKQLDLEGILQ